MKWTDIYQIAEMLADEHPGIDPRTIRFTHLRQLILDLPGFDDDPNRGGEKLFEAIQTAWIDQI